ncbi:L-histidine N(alpha)-methyltransferase [Panacagrimonas sp.]|uniref:L-histidine N(alpha)-methyltransferase n=1 Tax=Panacagrimonas sp. TaxID=2480088 RepID=UPI003B525F3E
MKLPSSAWQLSPEHAARDELAADVRKGLRATPKRLPSKYFYDARGSALFEQICEQPEYYLTRVELDILQQQAASMAQVIGPGALVVEYGSGSGIKTQLLLAALEAPVAYVPIEISSSALDTSLDELAARFPDIQMLPLCADFNTTVSLPRPRREPRSVLIFFPGSTLGNFESAEALRLLKVMHAEMGPQGAALVGIDLKKDPKVLEAAYNDAAGVTAEFTLNLLHRLNRELDMDFDVEQFQHRARYNVLAGRIETHIVSRADQQVHLDGATIEFAACEKMLVEYSCKYALPEFARMAAQAGLAVHQTWTDDEQRFAIQLLRRV